MAIGMAGVVIGFFYTAPPFKLAYRGVGELARLVATPLIVLGSFLVQVPLASPEAFYQNVWPLSIALASSLAVAFLNTGALYIFEFPDYDADIAAGKKNLVVRLGRKNAVYLFVLLSAMAYLSLVACALLGLLPLLSGIALIALPSRRWRASACRKNYDRPKSLIPYMKAASDAYIVVTIALIAAFLL